MTAKAPTRAPERRKPSPPAAPPQSLGLALTEETARRQLAEERLRALGSVRVHWGWGDDGDRHTYCALFKRQTIRASSLIELADRILNLERWG